MPFDESNGKDGDGGGDSERHLRGFDVGKSFAAQVIPDVINLLKKSEDICASCFAKGVVSTMANYATFMSHGIEDDGDAPDPKFVDHMGDIVAEAIALGFEGHKEWIKEQDGSEE